MRTLTDTLTAAQKRPATRPHPHVEVFDKVAGITRFHWERLYEGEEDEKFHASTMPGDGSLIRLRTDASNNLYRQRVTGPDEESTYSSWTDWSVEAYAVSLCSYGAHVAAIRIGTDGHLYSCESADSGASWGSWTDMGDASGDATFRLASCFKDADNCLILYSNGTTLYSIMLGDTLSEMAEDFTTYTEVDEDGDITVTATKCDVDTMRRDALSYVRKDKGAGHFTDFEHLVTCRCTAGDNGANCGIWALSNGSNTVAQMITNTEGLSCVFYHGAAAALALILVDRNSGNSDTSIALVEGTIYYLTIERNDTTLTCKIYDDSDRTNLIDTLSVVCTTLAYRYAFGIISREDSGTPTPTLTFYSEDLYLQEGGEGAEEWSNSLNSITGVAVVYQGDYNVIITGADASDNPGVWTCVLGDGYSAAVGNWSSLAEVMLAESASGVTYAHPALSLPDVYRAWFVEAYSGTESYSRPYWTHGISSADFISNLWREPVPFNLTSSYGLSLAWSGDHVWLTRADGVWRASVAAGSVELTTGVLGIKASAREATGEISVILRNDDGRFNSIGEDDDTYEHLKLGSELRFSPGYYTTDAGSPEHSSGPAYWIQSFDYLSKGGRSTLTVNAVDGWGLLERWKARRQYSWASGDKNIFQLLNFIHSRAGLEFSALGGSSSVVTDLKPAFTINPGESGKTAALRLLAMIPDVLFFRGYFGYLKYIQSTDSEDYTYGTDHAILEAHYHTSHKAANRVQVNSATIFTEAFDWEEIDLVFDILEQDYDLALTTTARTGARATAIERRQTVRSYNGYSVVPLNCGQEIYDVVKLTDQRAPLSAEKRRLLGIDHMFYPAKAEYRSRLILGAV